MHLHTVPGRYHGKTVLAAPLEKALERWAAPEDGWEQASFAPKEAAGGAPSTLSAAAPTAAIGGDGSFWVHKARRLTAWEVPARGPLPAGWRQRLDGGRRVYYEDTESGHKTTRDPRRHGAGARATFLQVRGRDRKDRAAQKPSPFELAGEPSNAHARPPLFFP